MRENLSINHNKITGAEECFEVIEDSEHAFVCTVIGESLLGTDEGMRFCILILLYSD